MEVQCAYFFCTVFCVPLFIVWECKYCLFAPYKEAIQISTMPDISQEGRADLHHTVCQHNVYVRDFSVRGYISPWITQSSAHLEETPFGAKSNFGVNIGKWMTTPTFKIFFFNNTNNAKWQFIKMLSKSRIGRIFN